jgi:hypothetical protein
VLAGNAALTGLLDQDLAAMPVHLDLVAPVPAVQTLRYTVALPADASRAGDATYPPGHGYATLQLTRKGAARLIGALGDGTAFSTTAQLTLNQDLALYLELYGHRGFVAGHLALHHDSDPIPDSLDGALLWQKLDQTRGRYLAGFTANIAPTGSGWSPATAPSFLTLTLAGAGLDSPLTVHAFAISKTRFSLDQPGLALTVDPASGLYRGNGALPRATLRGVFLPRQAIGFGQIVTPAATGPVDFALAQ